MYISSNCVNFKIPPKAWKCVDIRTLQEVNEYIVSNLNKKIIAMLCTLQISYKALLKGGCAASGKKRIQLEIQWNKFLLRLLFQRNMDRKKGIIWFLDWYTCLPTSISNCQTVSQHRKNFNWYEIQKKWDKLWNVLWHKAKQANNVRVRVQICIDILIQIARSDYTSLTQHCLI